MIRIPEQARDLLREHGPTAPVWRRRIAILSGAVLSGSSPSYSRMLPIGQEGGSQHWWRACGGHRSSLSR